MKMSYFLNSLFAVFPCSISEFPKLYKPFCNCIIAFSNGNNVISNFILWSLLFPIIIFPLIFFYSVKSLVIKVAAHYRPDLKPITTNDLMVARNTTKYKEIVDIGFVIKVEKSPSPVDIETLRQTFYDTFLKTSSHKEDPFRNLRSTFEIFWGYLFIKEVSRVPLDLLIYEDTFLSNGWLLLILQSIKLYC